MTPGRLSRLRAESVLAAGAALVGLIALVSTLTPEFADRSRLIRSIMPNVFPELARVLTLAFGLALLLLSRSLARRRRRAWELTVVAVVGVSVSHLVKGLDFEETIISVVFLLALLRYRTRFDAPGDPAVRRPVLGSMLALAGLIGFWVVMSDRGMPDRLGDLISVMALFLALWALMLWLGPFPEHVRQSIEERHRAHELVESFGSDSLAFFTLRRDKSYRFSPGGSSFLAYRLVGSTALISGDPVGEESEFRGLVGDFVSRARSHGWRVAVVGAGPDLIGLYRELGMRRVIKSATRPSSGRRPSPPRAGRSARCASRHARWPSATASASGSIRPRWQPRSCAPRSARSRTPGWPAAASAASRWRSTTCLRRGACSRLRSIAVASRSPSYTSFRARPAAATRSRASGACPARRAESRSF